MWLCFHSWQINVGDCIKQLILTNIGLRFQDPWACDGDPVNGWNCCPNLDIQRETLYVKGMCSLMRKGGAKLK